MKPLIMAMMLPRSFPRVLVSIPAEKHAEERAVGVAENPEHDRNDADVGMNDDEIGSGRGDDDHQNGKPDRGPAHGAQTLFARWRRGLM